MKKKYHININYKFLYSFFKKYTGSYILIGFNLYEKCETFFFSTKLLFASYNGKASARERGCKN